VALWGGGGRVAHTLTLPPRSRAEKAKRLPPASLLSAAHAQPEGAKDPRAHRPITNESMCHIVFCTVLCFNIYVEHLWHRELCLILFI
jgi:hypothetical protein